MKARKKKIEKRSRNFDLDTKSAIFGTPKMAKTGSDLVNIGESPCNALPSSSWPSGWFGHQLRDVVNLTHL